MLDLTKPENRCAVDGVAYVAVKDSYWSAGCSGCVAYESYGLCDSILATGVQCYGYNRKDGKDVHWRPASEVEGAASIRDGYRLLWPDEPREEGDEVYKEGLWELDDLSFPLSFVHGRVRRRKVG